MEYTVMPCHALLLHPTTGSCQASSDGGVDEGAQQRMRMPTIIGCRYWRDNGDCVVCHYMSSCVIACHRVLLHFMPGILGIWNSGFCSDYCQMHPPPSCTSLGDGWPWSARYPQCSAMQIGTCVNVIFVWYPLVHMTGGEDLEEFDPGTGTVQRCGI